MSKGDDSVEEKDAIENVLSARGETARAFFLKGYNCSQSVVAAYRDLIGIDFDTAMRLCAGYGGGIGRLREVCGAFNGAVMVLDACLGSSDPSDHAAKSAQYARIQRMAEKFRQKNGSIVCRELLGLPSGASAPTPEKRSPEYYKKRPCPQIIAEMAVIVGEMLREEGYPEERLIGKEL